MDMETVLYLDYIALIIYFLMLVAWFFRTRNHTSKGSMYLSALFIALAANIFDIISVLLDKTGNNYVATRYVTHACYLIIRNAISPMYVAYVISVTDIWHSLKKKASLNALALIPFSLVAVLTAISPFTKSVFYIDDSGVYTRGPLFPVLYFSAIFYLCLCAHYGIRYFRILNLERFIPIFSIIPGQLLAVGIQFFYPHILCEMFATSISLLLVMITIEKPEGKFDLSTGLIKSDSFFNMIVKAQKVKKPYCAVIINITNNSALASYLSLSNMASITSAIGRRIEAVSTHLHVSPEIYDLENGLFASVLYDDEMSLGARYATHLLDTLKHDYNVGGLTITILPSVCVLKVPQDSANVDELRLLLNDLRHTKYTGEISLATSFMKNKDYSVMANMDAILNKAIENDEFEVYYQPIYSNLDNRFNSAEALIRLNTAEYGFIRPDLFIPMAEDSGAIHKIGMIVLEKVCKFISSESFKELGLDYIEVNLSVVQCMDRSLAKKIAAVCDKYGVKPSQLNLEITETASSFALKNMMTNINTLYDMGYSFSLDDFGTGYSNLVRIASLPLHIVKLDKSFTWTGDNDDLKLILETTINMVKKMDMKIVVEGVETEEMLKRFRDLECEYIQGYYFSKPLPEFDFIQYIKDHQNS